jgi:hypothetical protein
MTEQERALMVSLNRVTRLCKELLELTPGTDQLVTKSLLHEFRAVRAIMPRCLLCPQWRGDIDDSEAICDQTGELSGMNDICEHYEGP